MDIKTANDNIGKMVHRTDGTPKPPKHHTKKVRKWEEANFSGRLVEINDYPEGIYACIKTQVMGNPSSPTAIFHRSGIKLEGVLLGEHPTAPADVSVL